MKRGEFLAYKREEKGLSVSDLSRMLNVSEWRIERWENGELPDSEYLLSLSSALDISVDDILRCEENDVFSNTVSAQDYGTEAGNEETTYVENTDNNVEAYSASSDDDGAVSHTGHNGYYAVERKLGYTLFAVFLIIVITISSIQLAQWINRPRELTLDNYKNFIQIEVEPTRDVNCEEFIVRVTAVKDISDLKLTVQVNFLCFGTLNSISRDVTFSGNIKKGESFEQRINTSSFSREDGLRVLSVEGGLD